MSEQDEAINSEEKGRTKRQTVKPTVTYAENLAVLTVVVMQLPLSDTIYKRADSPGFSVELAHCLKVSLPNQTLQSAESRQVLGILMH